MQPPELRLRLLRTAEEDLTEILTYIAAGHPDAADTLLTKFENNLLILAQHPRLGRIPEDETLTRLGYRYLVIDNYLVFYTLEDLTVYVHRIVHGARNYLSEF